MKASGWETEAQYAPKSIKQKAESKNVLAPLD